MIVRPRWGPNGLHQEIPGDVEAQTIHLARVYGIPNDSQHMLTCLAGRHLRAPSAGTPLTTLFVTPSDATVMQR